MKLKQSKKHKQLLQTSYPKLYDHLIEAIKVHNIHSYDVRATCQHVESEMEIQVNYGADFTLEHKRTFSDKEIAEIGDAFTEFCQEVGETCKETLIADYFKMMKP